MNYSNFVQFANKFCYYSKNNRIELVKELRRITFDLMQNIDTSTINIKGILGINKDDNYNTNLKKSIGTLKDKLSDDLIINLNSCWENCVLLYEIERCILIHPLLTYEFDDSFQRMYYDLKKSINEKTFISKRLLECFLNNYKKIIFLDNFNAPSWLSVSDNKYKLSKNAFGLITTDVKHKLFEQLKKWIKSEISLLISEIKFCKNEIDRLSQVERIWIRKMFCEDKIYMKYVNKINNYYIY